MRIAVTGGSGFLAGYLTDELLAHGYDVILLSRKAGSRKGISFTTTDYTESSLTELFSGIQISAIAHLASSRKVADNFGFYNDLIKTTENIYRAAEASGIRNIVYTSSIAVYSGNKLPYVEEQPPSPGNMYGLYKLACEIIGGMFARQGLKVKSLRLSHLYGANEENDYMINLFFRQAHAHEQLSVFCKSVAKREMLYAKDAARAIRLALEHPELEGSFNVGSNQPLTNEEIAKTICSEMSPELEVNLGDAVETIAPSFMDNSKAKAILGYEPQYSLRDAMREIAAEMQ